MNRRSFKGYVYLAPVLAIMLVFTAYPLVRAIFMSFCEDYSIINGSYKGINLENYADLFKDKDFRKAITNTITYVIFVVPLSVVISLLIANLLNSHIKFQGLFQTLYFLPYVTSVIAIGVVWRWILHSEYGLLNSILQALGFEKIGWLTDRRYSMASLIIFAVWKSLAFDIMIFLAALQGISPDLYSAARVDATPRWRVFFRITVPAMRPIIAYAFVMGIINAFKVYNEVFSLFNGSAGPSGYNSAITIVFYIYDKFYNNYKYGIAAAGSVVLFLLIMFFTAIQRLPGRIRARKEAAQK